MDYNIFEIIRLTKKNSTDFVVGKRNNIKIVNYFNENLSVKIFKTPNFITGIIYKFFRKSKAKRSYEHALVLEKNKIGTPKPIGYLENNSFVRLLDSYYICEHIEADYIFKDLFSLDINLSEPIYREFAVFCFKIHEAGIEFLDHSPGNTLIVKKHNNSYEFLLIDLNRMRFHKNMDFDLRMKNLNRLVPNEKIQRIISNEYAKYYKKNEEEIFEKLNYYTTLFFKKFEKKKKIKKIFKIN